MDIFEELYQILEMLYFQLIDDSNNSSSPLFRVLQDAPEEWDDNFLLSIWANPVLRKCISKTKFYTRHLADSLQAVFMSDSVQLNELINFSPYTDYGNF